MQKSIDLMINNISALYHNYLRLLFGDYNISLNLKI